MCFFKKWREKRKAKKLANESKNNVMTSNSNDTLETAINKELSKQEHQSENTKTPVEKETVEKLKIRPFSKPKVSNQEEIEWPKKEVILEDKQETTNNDQVDKDELEDVLVDEQDTEEEKLVEELKSKKSPEHHSRKYQGKYEVYPESKSYKFRLKASNGEILCVSFRYSSEKGALSGIETFKKNVEEGLFKIMTDKNSFSQFHLYNTNGARVIMVGEMYQSVSKANSAVDSVKKFYDTDKIDILDEVPKSEIREEDIEFESVEESNMGKYEILKENDFYYLRLRASNSQILFTSQGYSSKSSAKSGLKTIQKAIQDKNFTVAKDKQNRYQFNLYSATGQILVTGETYSQKSNSISAVHSVLKFGLKAVITEA
ncbi:YegP family protein [Hujiaoplasma nucleasis]|uniref:YegP family protein n=1 Tax=Hujiaoplasma nucleasis TaxID=2725268 RepID=A0A7L6N2D1_9MOLU|nr:YegP family protein [Hujiaoplasma nucleasis]QLY40323.1 YegP family protein [Hujiaoplasma nucleasis]